MKTRRVAVYNRKQQGDDSVMMVEDEQRPTCKSDHLCKESDPPSARCRPLGSFCRSISARCTEGFPNQKCSRCPLSTITENGG